MTELPIEESEVDEDELGRKPVNEVLAGDLEDVVVEGVCGERADGDDCFDR